jgi:glyoxylase-like metal-dependent hydrolase (beta-lactamase superfamily II)
MLLQKGRDTILIDSATADQQLYRTLTALGVDVDLLVLTHGHADHAGGLSDLIKYDKVNKVILWGMHRLRPMTNQSVRRFCWRLRWACRFRVSGRAT